MKKYFLAAICIYIDCALAAPNYKNTSEYKIAYECAIESLNSDVANHIAFYCLGNSRDPSKIEELAYKEAERYFSKGRKVKTPKNEAPEKSNIVAIDSTASEPSYDGYETSPFNMAIDNLGNNYQGHSCVTIASKLKEFNIKKDEFENSESYSKRISSISSEKLYGSITVLDTLSFVRNNSVTFSNYDADQERMSVHFLFPGKISVGQPYSLNFSDVINSRKLGSREYSASNSFGKTVDVSETGYEVCGLVFSNKNTSNINNYSVDIKLSIPPEEARSLKNNLSILFVGNLFEPYYSQYSGYKEPTIDSPYERFWTGDALIFNLLQIWVYDKSNGKVFVKQDH